MLIISNSELVCRCSRIQVNSVVYKCVSLHRHVGSVRSHSYWCTCNQLLLWFRYLRPLFREWRFHFHLKDESEMFHRISYKQCTVCFETSLLSSEMIRRHSPCRFVLYWYISFGSKRKEAFILKPVQNFKVSDNL